ncbi:DUF4224 domain-containing protein [Pseudomonas sichuanensis]
METKFLSDEELVAITGYKPRAYLDVGGTQPADASGVELVLAGLREKYS